MKFLTWPILLTLLVPPSQAAQNMPASQPSSDAEKTGEKLFFQRCSVCHLGTPPRYQAYGPLLDQELVASRGEDSVRNRILEGSPKMPGWKYSFKAVDVDNILAYLKTVKKQAATPRRSNQGPGEQVGGD